MNTNHPFPDSMDYDAFESMATTYVYAINDNAILTKQQMIATWATSASEQVKQAAFAEVCGMVSCCPAKCYELADWVIRKVFQRFHGPGADVDGYFLPLFKLQFELAGVIVARKSEFFDPQHVSAFQQFLGTSTPAIPQQVTAAPAILRQVTAVFVPETCVAALSTKIPFPSNKTLLSNPSFHNAC